MDDTIYEALGKYVDSLSNSLYLGTARGRVYLDGRPITPDGVKLSLFFSGKSIEVSSLWGKREHGALYLRGSPEVSFHSGRVELLFLTRKGRVLVRLRAGKGFARVLANTASLCVGGIGSLWVRS